MYNILSLLLGICALVFALHSLQVKFCSICCTLSGLCCGICLLCQLLQVRHLVAISDWSALMDTMPAVIIAATGLIAVNSAINIAALIRGRSSCCGK